MDKFLHTVSDIRLVEVYVAAIQLQSLNYSFLSFFFPLKVEGIFYKNELLEKLMFDELKHWAGTQGTVLWTFGI